MGLPGRELEALLGPAVPSDHTRQSIADDYIAGAPGRAEGRPWRVLDLGCGSGSSVDLFRARERTVEWVGLDVPGSREAGERVRTDARFEVFDGTSIPFDEGSFDLVYCKQVLEHVRQPLLAEVQRVLRGGGYFAGSTSQLEPFHSRSEWNYTPPGLALLIQEAGLRVVELPPGIDALTLIARRLVRRGRPFHRLWANRWGGRSPLNRVIDLHGRARGLDARAVNANKPLFCGQFTFLAQRPE